MKDYKFRGKRFDNGNWIYGDLINGCAMYIHEPSSMSKGSNYEMSIVAPPIDPETVGQFIWLKDKNGKEIYEGDIVHYWNEGLYQGYIKLDAQLTVTFSPRTLLDLSENDYVEVIGNIYDNPELIP